MLVGCGASAPSRWQSLVTQGDERGFHPVQFGNSPPIHGLFRHSSAPTLWVVIEGDGNAWLNPREPSWDPTPLDPTGWRIAHRLGVSRLLYLSRPCQYLARDELANCGVEDWTRGRFREVWVDRLNQAIDQAKGDARSVVLTGYSGGGVMAALLAARRNDVACLMTVASPLDHVAWTQLHGVSPLTGSLNPADLRDRLYRIPQLHWVGRHDRITPPQLVADFIRPYPADAPARIQLLPGQDHGLAEAPDLAQNAHCALMESCCEK